MKSLLRFSLMLGLIVVGKLNTTSEDIVNLLPANEPVWIIPVHGASFHHPSTVPVVTPGKESGKFRLWRMLDTATDAQ